MHTHLTGSILYLERKSFMADELNLLLQEIKVCRQKMYDLRPSSNDFSDSDLVKQSQKLDKLIFQFQMSMMKKEFKPNQSIIQLIDLVDA
jgi:Spo0E like sporulation regulatory protein